MRIDKAVSRRETFLNQAVHFITHSRVWRSIFRHGWPDNPLDRSLVMTSGLFFHLHPVKVSRRSLRATYSITRRRSSMPTAISSACRPRFPSASSCATCTAGAPT
jgi:hypothetical protein